MTRKEDEFSGCMEVARGQVIRCAVVGGRASRLRRSRQEAQGVVAKGPPRPDSARIGELTGAAKRNLGSVGKDQRQAARRRLAVQNRERPHQAEATLPQNQELMMH